MPAEITVVTTCRNRLHHLEETLPLYVGHVPVVVVDYGCEDNTTLWLGDMKDYFAASHGRLTAVRRPASRYHGAAARNDGLALVRTRWVAFVDADTYVHGRLDRLDLTPGAYYVAHHPGPPPTFFTADKTDWLMPTVGADLCGFLLAETDAVRKVGGYDEAFIGWGAEDTDLRTALAYKQVLRHGRMPADFLSFIPHDHATRHACDPAQAEAVHAERLAVSNEAYRKKWANCRTFRPIDAGLARVSNIPGLTAA